MTLLLIVEDDPTIRMVVRETLEDNGVFVVTAPDGERALALMQSHQLTPDIILLDMMMPIMDGAEFLTRKSKDPAIADIPVVLCTALSAAQVRPDCNADVMLVLSKPFSAQDLLRVLNRLRRTGQNPPYKSKPPPAL
jgi:CheY-like chemotaxis protein